MAEFSGKKFHFIGAGGIGMSGLAKVLIRNGAIVSGSDQEDSNAVAGLVGLGADITVGHQPENIKPPLDAVVISAAIQATNPELACAGEKGCKILKYAEMLGRIVDCYDGIAVAGTHGKSTTSGWLSFLLTQAGFSPSFIVGADIPQLGSSSGVGTGRSFVAEACEYDRSFLNLHPEIAVILNIEQDHLDYYRDESEIVDAFTDFALGTKKDGFVVTNPADRNVRKVLERLGSQRKVITFGLGDSCDFYAGKLKITDGSYSFDIYRKAELIGNVHIQVPGEHNVLNALAVTASAVTAGVKPGLVTELLPNFTGIDRRLMLKAKTGKVTILDDYAHHPTEIRASLSAIRQKYQPGRLWCVFQPHQYSRTRFLLDDFAESFKLADITVVPDIYFVRDTAESKSKVNAETLVERIRLAGSEAVFIPDFDGILEHLKKNVRPGDLVVTMGAGTIWKVADEYICWLGTNS